MFPLNFKKNRAEYYLNCLNALGGESIAPEDAKGWTVNDMIGLAGACFFCLSSHGPLLKRAMAEMQGKTLSPEELHPEHKEAIDEMIFNDIHAAIEFIGNLTMLVCDEEYDEEFEEFVQCGVTQEGETSKQVTAIRGFKEFPKGGEL